MIPVINTLKKHLQTRTGEVECGFRPTSDRHISKTEINKYLDNHVKKKIDLCFFLQINHFFYNS
jgi:hypothetical protein